MKLTRIFILASALAASAAHAQINQILGVIHAVQNAATPAVQVPPQQTGQDSLQDDQKLVARVQADQAARLQQERQQEQEQQDAFRAAQAQNAQAAQQKAQQMGAEQDAKDVQKVKDMEQRGQLEAQQELNAAVKIGRMCPDLVDNKFNTAERFIRCRNKGLTEQQQMTFVGGLPILAQAYAASMVQDVYEDNITDPGKGKAISNYYDGCYQRGAPCARPKW